MKRIIDKLKIHNRIRVGYGTAFFLLLISYLVTLLANRQLLNQAEFVDHTNKTITHLETILSDTKDGETGVLGYILMKDSRFLEPYYTSKSRVDATYLLLRYETARVLRKEVVQLQQQRLDTLHQLIEDKFRLLREVIDSFSSNNNFTGAMRLRAYEGKRNMDMIRRLILRMQITENISLDKLKEDVQSIFKLLNVIIIVSLVIAFLLLIFGFFTYMR
ncbi:MAG: hypothetical protein NVSMB7_04640 [Chitinophagaceae bacterium]